ncbi:MAG TPA: universal stress protein [Mycobacteriales bacterium]
MNNGRRILVGVDGSGPDWAALDWAAAEAASLGVDLALVHAGGCRPAPGWEPPDVRAQHSRWTREVVDAAVSRAHVCAADVAVQAWPLDGDPIAELLRLAGDADRVVLGLLHGCGAGSRLRGSAPAQIAARAGRPVVVVRGRPGPRGPVVAGIDGTDADDAVLEQALGYARRHRLPLRALHLCRTAIVDPSGLTDAYVPGEDATEIVETAVARWAWAYPEVLVESAALPGPAAQRLVEVSAGAGLVVVGGGGRAGLPAVLRGSVGHALLRKSRCPVLLAR